MTTTTTTRRPRKATLTAATVDEASPALTSSSAEAGASDAQPASKPSKAALVLALLQRAEGATLQQLVDATGWLPHTTRAALTGLKRKGHTVISDKPDGVRIYHVSEAGGAA